MDEAEYEAFIASFDGHRNYGIRVNTLKTSTEELLNLIGLKLDPIPWESQGFITTYPINPLIHWVNFRISCWLVLYSGAKRHDAANALLPCPVKKCWICVCPGGRPVSWAIK